MNLITKEQYLPWVELSVNHKKVLLLLGKGKENKKAPHLKRKGAKSTDYPQGVGGSFCYVIK